MEMQYLVNDGTGRIKQVRASEVTPDTLVAGVISPSGRLTRLSKFLRASELAERLEWHGIKVPFPYLKVCECGSEKAKSIGHSSWCPKWEA